MRDGKQIVNSFRVSKQEWIWPGKDKQVDDLSNLVGILTGFNMTYSEPWQIVNYGIGGNIKL